MANVSCAQSKKLENPLFLVSFESKDIGDIRFYLNINLSEGKIKGGSIQDEYKTNYSFFDRIKIDWFSGIKNDRLIFIEGNYQEADQVIKFKTIFYSPIGNYYFNGSIEDKKISGTLVNADGVTKGKINGELHHEIEPLTDYVKLTERIISSFESTFFNPEFFESSKYKKFKNKLLKYSSKSIDDLHFVFSVFYYARELPYSHIGVWRENTENTAIENEENEENEEIVTYKKKGEIGILDIQSFSTEEGIITSYFKQILNDNSLKSLIIDLRDNSGGNIGPAIELGQFLVTSPLSGGYFLTREYYTGKDFKLDSCYIFSEGNIDQFLQVLDENVCIKINISPNQHTFQKAVYILINENTASTCEPVVYALKKQKNITIIGQKTAGKMLSAKEISLMDGYQLFVPNADYISDEQVHLDQKGVEPDIPIKKEQDALEYTLRLISK